MRQKIKSIDPTFGIVDVPTEGEANIISKRVCENICGAKAVLAFAEQQIHLTDAGTQEEIDRWIFFKDVPSSTPFDFVQATLLLVERYKTVLDFGMDVESDGWWVGPLKDKKRKH